MVLKVIDGGAAGGGPKKRKFKPHPLADSLWRSVYPKDAISYEQIRERMSRHAKKEITFHQVNNCIYHVRHHAYDYEWDIAHVQKGAIGEHRAYFPILVDAKDPDYRVVSEDHVVHLKKGVVSSANTLATMAEHESVALEIFANLPDVDRGDKRILRAASSMFTAAAKMAQDVIGKVA